MVDDKLIDEQSRKTIVEDLGHNYFVEASAGSGKTTSLVYRMVALVESGVPVEKICTITFTKAAANEFFERFQRLLSIRSGDEPDSSDRLMPKRTEDSKKRCQEALNNIDLCFLGTIDSFCNMVAHEMPAELKIPSSSTVISGEEYTRIVKEKYNEILKKVDHPLHELAVKFNNFIEKPFDAFVYGISAISDFRNLKVDYDSELADMDFDVYFDYSDKKQVLEIFDNLTHPSNEDLYDDSTDSGKGRIKNKEELARKYKDLGSDVKHWADKVTNLKYALKNVEKMNQFKPEAEYTSVADYLAPKGERAKTVSYSDDFKATIDAIKSKINEYLYSLYIHFVLSVLKEVTDSLRVQGKFQFFDFLLYLRDAFQESAMGDRVLINHVFERHSYFMLDESQDTNPLQTEMFFYLTGTKKDKDWRKMEPKEGSLFIVGDPKQSIYSFRGADVKAYLDNKEIFNGNKELLLLTKNFRSHASLREWFNNSFNDVLNYTDEVSKEFSLEHPTIPIDDDDITKTIPYGNPNIMEGVYRYKVTSGTRDDCDCEELAKLIIDFKNNKQIYQKSFDKVTGKDRVDPRPITYKDFLVVPKGAKMEKIVQAFNAYNIPMIVEGKVDFTSAESFNAVLDLLYLVKEPSNIAAFNRVIFSSLYNLSDMDIIQMLNDGFDLNIANPSIEEIKFSHSKHEKIIKELNELYKKTLGLSFSSSMQLILNDKDIDLFSHISFKNLEYIYYLIEKVKEGEESGAISTLEQLKNHVDLFLNNGDEQRTIRFSEEVDRVKVANLHKVKGLQAQIVILARPSDKPNKINTYIDYKAEPPTVKFSYIEDKGNYNSNIVSTNRFIEEQPKWEAYKNAEHDRLVYVGATRAEAVLVVTERAKDEDGYWKPLTRNIKEEDRILPVPNSDKLEPTIEEIKLGSYNINEKSHNPSFEYISPSQSRIGSGKSNKDEIDDALFEQEDDEGRKNATLMGTMVHKLMECIVSSKNSYDINSLIKNILLEFGYDEEIKAILQNVASKILSGGFEQVNSSLDKDILNVLLKAKKVWCEVPFSYQSGKGNIIHGIIDCMYVDNDDKYHIIDYKTNAERDVKELEKHYEGQLTHYICALKKMGIEADAHIYHIDL